MTAITTLPQQQQALRIESGSSPLIREGASLSMEKITMIALSVLSSVGSFAFLEPGAAMTFSVVVIGAALVGAFLGCEAVLELFAAANSGSSPPHTVHHGLTTARSVLVTAGRQPAPSTAWTTTVSGTGDHPRMRQRAPDQRTRHVVGQKDTGDGEAKTAGTRRLSAPPVRIPTPPPQQMQPQERHTVGRGHESPPLQLEQPPEVDISHLRRRLSQQQQQHPGAGRGVPGSQRTVRTPPPQQMQPQERHVVGRGHESPPLQLEQPPAAGFPHLRRTLSQQQQQLPGSGSGVQRSVTMPAAAFQPPPPPPQQQPSGTPERHVVGRRDQQ